jgi:hypothetical protein
MAHRAFARPIALPRCAYIRRVGESLPKLSTLTEPSVAATKIPRVLTLPEATFFGEIVGCSHFLFAVILAGRDK